MTRVALVGLGPIGLAVGRAILMRPELRLVAAVDVAPSLAGRPLAELVPGAPTVAVQGSLRAALEGVDAVALCTGSKMRQIAADLEAAIDARLHVVSTCEELAAPVADPALWERLDERARAAGVTVIGTGVNPGFVMDRLVLQLAGACTLVTRVRVERVVDSAQRRDPLRRKVGEDLSVEEFRAGAAAGRIGHVGLHASAWLIARGLGWRLDGYRETLDPVIGKDGRCLGLCQRGHGTVDGEERIRLWLEMFAGASDPHDHIALDADPPIDVRLAGGVQGERGTVGTMVQALARLPRAPRGLVTVADVFC
jgi:4-hydroxy-tetrahydrodipicolinate reductase